MEPTRDDTGLESLGRLYPDLTNEQLLEAHENLTRYIMIAYGLVKSLESGPQGEALTTEGSDRYADER